VSLLPAGATLTNEGGKLLYEDFVVDYHYGYDFAPVFRIKSLAAEKTDYEFNELVNVYTTVDNASANVTYKWFVDEELIGDATTAQLQWTAPSNEGTYVVRVEVTSGEVTLSEEIEVRILEDVPEPPFIEALQMDGAFFYENDQVEIICDVASAGTELLSYEWEIPAGTFEQNDSLVVWTAPSEGLYRIRCTVTNGYGLSAPVSKDVLIKNNTRPEVDPLAYYPLDVNVEDYSGNEFDAEISHASEAADQRGNTNAAYAITSTDDIISVPNALSLNFVDEITLSCWFSSSASGREAFVLSHGSWEERWKISITPDLKIRWTVKTSAGVKDLDSSEPIASNEFYHLTAVYTGYSMELYINGELDNYDAHEGSMLTTDHDITFGQKSTGDTQYFLNGVIDEVRIFNEAVQPWQIANLKTLWTDDVTGINDSFEDRLVAYPNPAVKQFVHIPIPFREITSVRIISYDGKAMDAKFSHEEFATRVELGDISGYFVLEVTTSGGQKRFRIISLN
ncbi:MAG TPA: LamG-like jellyroll fold domain-containing protein, partial [Chryseosolibacter sp.]|nr:LamG-like jellyroll fold domain-containing protein [Chryseosolibacter sp.]